MAGGSADIGIRVFLDDAASQALGAINGGLARMVSTTRTASRSMGELSGAMAGVGVAVGFAAALLAFGAAIKYSVDQASLFQQAMFGVAIATHVPMATAMQYSNVLMNLAASSIYTSAQIADGIVQMGRAGYGIQAIFGGMAQAGIALGIATRTTAVQGFTLLTQAMAAYKAPASEAMHYADLLQFAFEHQRGSVAELTSGLSQVTPAAAQFGVPLREIVAALDVVGPAMRSTATAGTALRYMLSGLYQPTAGAQKEMIALGLGAVDAGGKFHSSFYDARGNALDFDVALHLLAAHLQGLSQEDRLAALKNLFSVRGGQGADILLGNISKLDAYLRQLQGSSDNAGGAMRRWNEVMQTLGGAMAGLKSSVTDLAVVIGGQFLPVLTNIANQANGFISHIRSMAAANPAATGSFLKLGAAMSGVGLVATIVILAIAGIGTGILAFIGIVAGVAAGVVGLTIGIMLLVNWFRNLFASSALVRSAVGALGDMFNQLGAQLRGAWMMAMAEMGPMLRLAGAQLRELGSALQPLLPLLGFFAAIILGVVIGAIHGLIMALIQIVIGLSYVLAGVVMIMTGVVNVIMGALKIIVGLFTLNRALVLEGLGQLGRGIVQILMGALLVLIGIIRAVFGAIIGFVVGFVMGFISWIEHLASVVVGHSIIPDMMNAIRNVIISGLAAVVSAVISGVMSIIAQFIHMGAMVISVAVAAWSMFRTVVQIAIAVAVALVSAGAANMVSRVVSLGANIVMTANNAWNGFKNAVSNGINSAVGFVQSGVSRIIGVISGLPGQLYSWGARAMQSFASGLTSAIGSVTSAVSNAAGTVANFLGHLSPAKTGPLSQDDRWMPNMMHMFASQIEGSAPLLQNALSKATGSMSAVPQLARIAGPTTAPTAAGGGGGGGSKVVQLVVNGRILGQAVMDDFTTQLQLNGAGRAFR